ncbi:Dihydrofolate reductase [Pirellulimonas nuda]|uniref:dihydrofolate reductase n=1 Tax=Pirellulimonas nuda TaxID=2528009 RepID=A0A518DFT3_9BACT|nr:dihydrofolate reductase [Pirellulimonas nuda]QDU90292.1 Dihydrofolate reductase [Pirellulimonas nuda]
MRSPLIIIAAMSDTRVLGAGDGMPWDVPEEYETFLDAIRGQTLLMGRRSWEIFGPDLPAAHVVVLSRTAGSVEGAEVQRDLPSALTAACGYTKPVFCGGGAGVYAQCLPLADELRLSTIKGAFAGDAYFPEFDRTGWRLVEQRDEPRYVFRRWLRAGAGETPG